jgi:hypothetical protein
LSQTDQRFLTIVNGKRARRINPPLHSWRHKGTMMIKNVMYARTARGQKPAIGGILCDGLRRSRDRPDPLAGDAVLIAPGKATSDMKIVKIQLAPGRSLAAHLSHSRGYLLWLNGGDDHFGLISPVTPLHETSATVMRVTPA